jgi:hypothetical protein
MAHLKKKETAARKNHKSDGPRSFMFKPKVLLQKLLTNVASLRGLQFTLNWAVSWTTEQLGLDCRP